MLGPLLVGIESIDLSREEHRLLAHPLIGGVILFARNYSDPEQLAQLTAQIKAVKSPRLMIAVDQEGGRVQRFHNGFSAIEAMAHLGERYNSDSQKALQEAIDVGWLLASELLSCGVDFSFTPVLDLRDDASQVIGQRAFSDQPEVVAALGEKLMQGMRQAGMTVAVGKHYPGHGGVVEDSHLTLPVDTRSFSELWQNDLLPFRKMIQAGLAGVMASHVVYPQVDQASAGYSHYWLQNILREQLGFTGLIFSDDLGMGAAFHQGDAVARVQAALQAGCDMALLCNERDDVLAVLDSLPSSLATDLSARVQNFYGSTSLQSLAALKQDARYQQTFQRVQAAQLCTI
ncbi:beta-hexosaminidase [Piscirickettsia salmonis]|uniref:Beta-hexosaminidase n=1 Tax=Piscirickettsia salmonis TaxID=1238 RepID=A0A9Q6LUY1_PISSA|nr:beta-N-acetylhexosaminidase [Piscirickettsia salmonis]RNC78043.1 beta-N-acetylhexosaminidase [Piscirickettsiaceae bacterium NZ-RLO2]ALA24568.1 glycosyl hydrolase [Piscirickettsia salmonis]APS44915.1 beta-hexosaminidase [Piscirickettsia salmonis]APS48277.1 beta-hexosaminidase [Piscirickettsia salmonis]APS49538.1 beta-hexosaminidase [Piscirickettsia salmonis]